MANSVDPDQTASLSLSLVDTIGLGCSWDHYSMPCTEYFLNSEFSHRSKDDGV